MQQKNSMIHPFRIDIDPMERLLLVNFEKDPDTVYVGFEPQVFDDSVNGRGHLVIGWRQDGRVDVYHQPGLQLDPDKYDIAGKGLANMIEREMAGAAYDVDHFGVQAHYEFRDLHDRAVVIKIREQNPKARRPFDLLAPMGSAAETPSALPLVLLHDFYFVRKRQTSFEISIAGKRHQPDELPVPMDFTRMYFTRYSPRPLIATLNPAFHGRLKPFAVEVGADEVSLGETTLALEWIKGKPALKRLTRHNAVYPLELRFDRAFPSIQALADNARLEGKFEIEGKPSAGRITGGYTVEKKDGQISVTMLPSGGWQPRPTKLSLHFLYTVAKIFRKWPSTYEWTAHIHEEEAGAYTMRSAWRRIKS